MSYVTLSAAQARDKLVGPIVEQADLDRADLYVDNFAKMKDVDPTDSEQFVTPVHYFIQEMILYFVFEHICIEKMGINPRAYQNNVSDDVYAQKYTFYRSLRNEWEDKLTPEIFAQVADTPEEFVSTSIELYRS